MPDIWQTIEEAGVTLGLSVRTINRYVTAGKLQSRLFEGRREVLVTPGVFSASNFNDSAKSNRGRLEIPSTAENDGSVRVTSEIDGSSNGQQAQSIHSSRSSPIASDHIGDKTFQPTRDVLDMQTMLTLTDSIDDKATLAVAAYQTLARSSESQVQTLRRAAFGAWATVALMASGIILAVGYGTWRLTTAEVTATLQQTELIKRSEERRELKEEVDQSKREVTELKIQLERAKEQSQKLNTMADIAVELKRIVEARPSTQPGPVAPLPTTVPSSTKAADGNVFFEAPVVAPNDVPSTGPFRFSPPPGRGSLQPASRPIQKPTGVGRPLDAFGTP